VAVADRAALCWPTAEMLKMKAANVASVIREGFTEVSLGGQSV
jgi:hypothetical protein